MCCRSEHNKALTLIQSYPPKKKRTKRNVKRHSQKRTYRWQITSEGVQSLAFRKRQIKTTLRCHYIPVIVAKIKNSDNTKSW